MPQTDSPGSLPASANSPSDPYYGGPLGAGIDWSDPNSPLARFYFSTVGVLAATILGLSWFLMSLLPLIHTDFWSHLKYGEWICTHHRLPDVEPLNPFTDKEQPFFDAMWLSQVLYHAAFQIGQALGGSPPLRRFEGGVEMIRLLHLLVSITALGLFAWAVRRVSASPIWGLIALIYGLVMLMPLLIVQRPQTLAFVPLMLLMVGLSRLIVHPEETSWRPVWQLPVVLVVWANLHGSFVVGLLLCGLVLLGLAGQQLGRAGRPWRIQTIPPSVRRWFLGWCLAIVAVALSNPYGPRLYWHVWQFGQHPNLRTMAEWQPLQWTWGPGGHWSYLLTVFAVLTTWTLTRRSGGISSVLVVACFSLWPLVQQRMMAWWAVLMLWLIAPCWSTWASQRGWCWRWGGVPSFRKTALAALIVVVAWVASPASHWLKQGRPRPFSTALYPATPYGIALAFSGADPHGSGRAQQLLTAWHNHAVSDRSGPIFCSERLGEFLLWALAPSSPVMMFNHAQLFAPSYWNECLAIKQGEQNWQELLQRYGARWIVVEVHYHPQLCQLLRNSPHWQVLLDEADVHQLPEDARLLVAQRR
jgi:hypothetical protein